jgi:hypothetical protein
MPRAPLRWILTTAAVTTVATLFATTAPAHADGPGTPNQPPPDLPATPPQAQEPQVQPQPQPVPAYAAYQQRRHKQSHWYGWQTLIVDGAWIIGAPLLAGAGAGEAAGALVLGGYLLGAPIVHWSHSQVGRGFGSLGIRVGAPIVLGALGYAALHDSGSSGDVGGAVGGVLGVFLGMTAAIVIDAAVLAYEPDEDDDEDAQARRRQRNALQKTTITPMLAPRTEGGSYGAVFGVSGTLF